MPRRTQVPIESPSSFAYEGFTPCARIFQCVRLTSSFVTLSERCNAPCCAGQPPSCNACRLSHRVGLGSSHFARHYFGNLSLFLGVLRCFSSPRALHLAYVFNQE